MQNLTHASASHDASVQNPRRTMSPCTHSPDASQTSLVSGTALRRQQAEAGRWRAARPRLLHGR